MMLFPDEQQNKERMTSTDKLGLIESIRSHVYLLKLLWRVK